MVKQEEKERIIDAGEHLISWTSLDKPPVERSTTWYIGFSVIGIGLLTYAVFTANYLFALLLIMLGVLFLIFGLHKPREIDVHITTDGIVYDNHFYNYRDIRDFSIIYEPPISEVIYIDTKGALTPPLRIDYSGLDPMQIRDTLLLFLDENLSREEEMLTDLAQKVYKL
jgi:hypothetical protein